MKKNGQWIIGLAGVMLLSLTAVAWTTAPIPEEPAAPTTETGSTFPTESATSLAVASEVVTAAPTTASSPSTSVTAAVLQRRPLTGDERKLTIMNAMLCSTNFFRSAQGKFTTTLGEGTVEYIVDVDRQASYERIVNMGNEIENFYRDAISYRFDRVRNTYEEIRTYSWDHRLSAYDPKKSQMGIDDAYNRDLTIRITQDEQGYNECHYPASLSHAWSAQASICAQSLAFGFLGELDRWDVTGTDACAGRSCLVLEGTSRDDYGGKLGVEHFRMLVDDRTGILLDFEGYDQNGEVTEYLHTEEIRIDAEETAAALDEMFAAAGL